MTDYQDFRKGVEEQLAWMRRLLTGPDPVKQVEKFMVFIDHDRQGHMVLIPDIPASMVSRLMKHFAGLYAATRIYFLSEVWRAPATDREFERGRPDMPPEKNPQREEAISVYALDKATGFVMTGSQSIQRDPKGKPYFSTPIEIGEFPDGRAMGPFPSIAEIWPNQEDSLTQRVH